MKYMYFLFIYLYAGLSILANLLAYQSRFSWVLVLALFSSLALFLSPFVPYSLIIGLLGLALTAWLNGILVLGDIHLYHHFIRGLISLLLVGLGYYTHFLPK